MVIWEIKMPVRYGAGAAVAYGTPVEIFVPGAGYRVCVYTFGDGRAPSRVVHHRSGRVLASCHGYVGSYQEQAREACANSFERQRTRDMRAWHLNIYGGHELAPVINTTVKVVSC